MKSVIFIVFAIAFVSHSVNSCFSSRDEKVPAEKAFSKDITIVKGEAQPQSMDPALANNSIVEKIESSGVDKRIESPEFKETTSVESSGVKETAVESSGVKETAVESSGVKETAVESSGVKKATVESSGAIEGSGEKITTIVEGSGVQNNDAKPTTVESSGEGSGIEASGDSPAFVVDHTKELELVGNI
uniref:DUF148 domain-containing protein n=1 Tax=Rhabditophanes sp. KR3021 TaxID=114890 RepID=A0AC35U492_9BILA